jgi:hypothetical protein
MMKEMINMKKNEYKKMTKRTEELLHDLLKGEDSDMEVNVRYGLLDKDFTVKLSKQMTLDFYAEGEEAENPYFHVLNVTIDRRAYDGKWHERRGEMHPETPMSLAVRIHREYKRLIQ